MNTLSEVIFHALRERVLRLPASAIGLRSHALPTEDHLNEVLAAVDRLFTENALSDAVAIIGSSATASAGTRAQVLSPHEAAAEATRLRNEAAKIGTLLYFNTDSVPGEAGLAFLDELTAADIASDFGRVAKLELLKNLADRRARVVRARISDASVELLATYKDVANRIGEAAALPLLGFLPSASTRPLLPGVAPAVEFDRMHGVKAANRILEAKASIQQLKDSDRADDLAAALGRRLLPGDRDSAIAQALKLAESAHRIATGREGAARDRCGLTVEFVRLLRGGANGVRDLLIEPSSSDGTADPTPVTGAGPFFEHDVLEEIGREALELPIEVDTDAEAPLSLALVRDTQGDEIALRPSVPTGLFEVVLNAHPTALERYENEGCAFLVSRSDGGAPNEVLTSSLRIDGARANAVSHLPESSSGSRPQELKHAIEGFVLARRALIVALSGRLRPSEEGAEVGGLRHALLLVGGYPLSALAPLGAQSNAFLAAYRALIDVACAAILPDAINQWLVNLDLAFTVTAEQRVSSARLLPLHPLRIARALRWLDSGIEPPQLPARLAVNYKFTDPLAPAGADLFSAISVSPPARKALCAAAANAFDATWTVLRPHSLISALRVTLVDIREPAAVVSALVDQARERFEADAEVGTGVHLDVTFVTNDPILRETFRSPQPAELSESARDALLTRCGEGVSLSLAGSAAANEADAHLVVQALDVVYARLPDGGLHANSRLPLRYIPGAGGNVAQVELRDADETVAYERLLKTNDITLGRRGLEPAASSPSIGNAIVRAIVARGGWPVRAHEVPLLRYVVSDGHVVAILCDPAVANVAVANRLSEITASDGVGLDELRRGVVGLYSCRNFLTDLLDPEHDDAHLRGNLGLVRAFLRASDVSGEQEVLPINVDSPEGLRWGRLVGRVCGGSATRPDLLLLERRKSSNAGPRIRVVELKARAAANSFETHAARGRLSEQARIAAARVERSFANDDTLSELKGAFQRLLWLEAGRQHKALEWAGDLEALEAALDSGAAPDVFVECWIVPEVRWEGPDQFEEDHPLMAADGTATDGPSQAVRFEILQPVLRRTPSAVPPPESPRSAHDPERGPASRLSLAASPLMSTKQREPDTVDQPTAATRDAPPAAPELLTATPPPDPSRLGMRVVLGMIDRPGLSDEATWTPNLTDRVNHFNVGITGTMGTGKTQITKSLLAQLLRQGPHNVTLRPPGLLIFDYKGDYVDSPREPFASALGAVVLEPMNLPLNPLRPYTPTSMQDFVLIPRGFADTLRAINPQMGAVQRKHIIDAVEDCFEEAGIKKTQPSTWNRPFPTLHDLLPKLDERKRAQGIPLAIVEDLVALGVFADKDPKTDFDQFFDAVHVLNLRPVTEAKTVVRSIICFFMNAFYARMVRGGEAPTSRSPEGREMRALRRLVLVDEADDFIGLGLNSLKLVMQQGRSFGCGVILSTQLLDHFEQGDDPLKALVGTWILHQMPDLKPGILRNLFGLGSMDDATALAHRIITLPKHTSLCRGLSNEGLGTTLTQVRDLAYKDLPQ